MNSQNLNLDLGIPHLFKEWKKMFSTRYLTNDLSAGVTVAFVAIPLSLAIALASGATPAAGLVTAIIAGVVCALLGGSSLSVSGPAAAMSVLVADTIEKFGMKGLIFIGMLAGLMQLGSGIFGLGRLGRYVPLPVIAGFTAGIGVIIFIGQLPRAFGLLPPPESHILEVFKHVLQYSYDINLLCFSLVILTVLIIRALPKLFPSLPSILIAVVTTSFVVWIFNIKSIALIGDIPRSLPLPHIPVWDKYALSEIFLAAFTIYLLASLETLLSTSAIDKLTHAKKHDANQELIGQGIGNILVSFFGGIPVTSVIVRSATNVRAGAKTRRASIIHALIILLTVFAIAPLISLIPIAALAGVLFSVAATMINFQEFQNLWRTARSEALIYAITFFTIIFVDLIAGVQAGMIAAGAIVLYNVAKTHLKITSSSQDGILRLTINGALTFLSSGDIGMLEKNVEKVKNNETVILDLTNLTNLDSSGASAVVDLFHYCIERKIKFYMKGLPRRFERILKICGGDEMLEKYFFVNENEIKKLENGNPLSSHERLMHGIQQFYIDRKHNDRRLYEYIASKQDPHTLFIACSDSRIIPTLMTSTDPGELFTIRNIGNFIPPYDSLSTYSEGAALEFALANLNISDIVICGHANCGAMKACQEDHTHHLPPKLKAWIEMMREQLNMNRHLTINEMAQINVLNQVENLKNYPIVQSRKDTQLNIHAWYFDFEESLIYEWDKTNKNFKALALELV